MKKLLFAALTLTMSVVAFAQNPIDYLPEQSMIAIYADATKFKGTAIERLVKEMSRQMFPGVGMEGIDWNGSAAAGFYPASTNQINLDVPDGQMPELPDVLYAGVSAFPGQTDKLYALSVKQSEAVKKQCKKFGGEGATFSQTAKTIDGMRALEMVTTVGPMHFRSVDVYQSADVVQSFGAFSGKPVESVAAVLNKPEGKCKLLTADALQDVAFAVAFDVKSIMAMLQLPDEIKQGETYKQLAGLDKLALLMKIKDNMAIFLLSIDCIDAKNCDDLKMEIATMLAPLQGEANPQNPFSDILKTLKTTPRGDKGLDVSMQVSMDLVNVGAGMLMMAAQQRQGQICGMETDADIDGEIVETEVIEVEEQTK